MWTQDMFGVEKPIIALLHLDPLPGDPAYCGNMDEVIRHAAYDLKALQDGGVDGILFANEFSSPFSPKTEFVTVAAMARIVGQLLEDVSVPYGVNIVMGPMATLELAAGTDAKFIRSAFTGAYTGNYGVYVSGDAEVIRRKKALGLDNVKLFYKANPEGDVYLNNRVIKDAMQQIASSGWADALCVSGASAGMDASSDLLVQAKEVAGDVPVFCNTGCKITNVHEKLAIADGACMGTGFKVDGKLKNHVDPQRVKEFMEVVKDIRKNL